MYWYRHPRFRFVKILGEGNFLDAGCGDGALQFWLDWGMPVRDDIKMYGADVQRGQFVDRYCEFKQFNFNDEQFPYDGYRFDTVLSSHVFEHLEKPEVLIKNLDKILNVDGMIYIEVPNHNSLKAPTLAEHKDKNSGLEFLQNPTNFHDDKSHLTSYSKKEIISMFKKVAPGKYRAIKAGTICEKHLEQIMLSYGYKHKDNEIMTYALWSHYMWCDYVILKKFFK